jgi:hypothetical protein
VYEVLPEVDVIPVYAPPGTRRSAATDAVRLAPSPLPLPRLGAVAMSVTTTSLDGVCGAVCGDACVPGLGVDWRGLGVVWRARVGGWVGFEGVRFVRFVCLSRVCPGSPRCLFTVQVGIPMNINCRVREPPPPATLFGAPQGLHASLPRSKAVRWDAVGLAARVGGREEAQRGA